MAASHFGAYMWCRRGHRALEHQKFHSALSFVLFCAVLGFVMRVGLPPYFCLAGLPPDFFLLPLQAQYLGQSLVVETMRGTMRDWEQGTQRGAVEKIPKGTARVQGLTKSATFATNSTSLDPVLFVNKMLGLFTVKCQMTRR